jgi:hypothetical protein
MIAYLRRHESLVEQALQTAPAGFDWEGLARLHGRRLGHLQHERLAHLLVTLFVALLTLLCFISFWLRPGPGIGVLLLLFLVLLVPYLAHYFRLENGVQRLYSLADELDHRVGRNPGADVRP